MASWGPKLYQDDIAVEVKEYFKDQLKRGKSNEEVTNELIQQYQDSISDDDDAPIFWFALADTQWDLGRLLPFVKEKALKWLSDGSDLIRWESENPKEAKLRKKVLENLQQKLHSPMPSEKKMSQYKLYKCEWNKGDVFAYRLESELAKENGLYGRYFIIRKIDEINWWPGHISPIVYISITKDQHLPSLDTLSDCDYVQISVTIDRDPNYKLHLITTSKRVLPLKKLINLGNIDISGPKNEKIIEKNMLPSYSWKGFEEYVLESYLKLGGVN